MKPIITVYTEGFDTKVAVLSRDKDVIKIHRVISTSVDEKLQKVAVPAEERGSEFSMDELDGDISFGEEKDTEETVAELDDTTTIASSLIDFNLAKCNFIPSISEPAVNYHIYEGDTEMDKNELIDAVINDIQANKGLSISKDIIDVIRLDERTLLAVFLEGEIPGLSLVNSLANYNGRKFYRIPSIKSAEISLAYYVSRSFKLFPQDYSLVVYTGKEYSRLIFLEGQRLKHIGSRLEIGVRNIHSYDVYFSKILLEMENGNIPQLDNVIICGEDNSEDFVLSFYSTFPEANVHALRFDALDSSDLDEDSLENLGAFAIPIATGIEYCDEQTKDHAGINILPKYIYETQKIVQFGWHSYVILAIIFLATFLFTFLLLSNNRTMSELDSEIFRLTQLKIQNEMTLDQINVLSDKINNFDQSQAILDSAKAGSDVWNAIFERVSNFVGEKGNFWVTKFEKTPQNEIKVNGYAMSRKSLTEFAEFTESATLRSINYEPLREVNTYAFTLTFALPDELKEIEVINGPEN